MVLAHFSEILKPNIFNFFVFSPLMAEGGIPKPFPLENCFVKKFFENWI